MHLFITDRLTCPRCGPEFGLILLAHEVRDRRVLEGEFGCANCRERYPVEGGFGDLRAPPRDPLEPTASSGRAETGAGGDEDGEGFRLSALLGVTEGPGTLLLTGPVARLAGRVAGLVQGVEVVGMDPCLRDSPLQEGVSALVSRPGVPFFSSTFKGVALSGEVNFSWVEEAARVVGPLCRVVLLDPPKGAEKWLQRVGLRPVMDEGGVLVALREKGDPVPLVTLRGP